MDICYMRRGIQLGAGRTAEWIRVEHWVGLAKDVCNDLDTRAGNVVHVSSIDSIFTLKWFSKPYDLTTTVIEYFNPEDWFVWGDARLPRGAATISRQEYMMIQDDWWKEVLVGGCICETSCDRWMDIAREQQGHE